MISLETRKGRIWMHRKKEEYGHEIKINWHPVRCPKCGRKLMGVVSILAAFSVSPKWLKLLTGFKQKEKLTVDYFDTETLEIKRTEMFISGYRASLVKDTSYTGLWKVSFTLKEF